MASLNFAAVSDWRLGLSCSCLSPLHCRGESCLQPRKRNNESHKIYVKELIFLFKKSAGRNGAIFHQYSEFWTGTCDHLTRQTGNSVRSLLASEGNNAVSAAAAVLDTLGQTCRTQGPRPDSARRVIASSSPPSQRCWIVSKSVQLQHKLRLSHNAPRFLDQEE